MKAREMTRIWEFPPLFFARLFTFFFPSDDKFSQNSRRLRSSVLNTLALVDCVVNFYESPQTHSRHLWWALTLTNDPTPHRPYWRLNLLLSDYVFLAIAFEILLLNSVRYHTNFKKDNDGNPWIIDLFREYALWLYALRKEIWKITKLNRTTVKAVD